MSTPHKIVIEIEGGLVTAVHGSVQVDVLIVDHDVIYENAYSDFNCQVDEDFDAIEEKVDTAILDETKGLGLLEFETMSVQPAE